MALPAYPIEAPPAVVVAQWRSDAGVMVTAAMCGAHNAIHEQAFDSTYVWRHWLGPDDAGARCVFCDPLTRVAWAAGVDAEDDDLDQCETCSGTGEVEHDDLDQCETCSGTGEVEHDALDPCETCSSAREVEHDVPLVECPECAGLGVLI